MVDPIDVSRIGGIGPSQGPSSASPADKAGGPSFKDTMAKALAEVNQITADADQSIEKYMTGQTDNVGEVMSAVQKADLAFSALQQIRNKLVEAYQEIQQMRI